MSKCRHFNGIQHDACKAGIRYDTFRTEPRTRLPCLPNVGNALIPLSTCKYFDAFTTEEQASIDKAFAKAIAEHLEKLASGVCPVCGKATEPRKRVGRCLYAACGHRIGQA